MQPDPMDPANRRCRTCRYWDAHSLDFALGDCRAPEDHRHWRYRSPDSKIVALLDSFGREETKPNYGCGAWQGPSQPLQDGPALISSQVPNESKEP